VLQPIIVLSIPNSQSIPKNSMLPALQLCSSSSPISVPILISPPALSPLYSHFSTPFPFSTPSPFPSSFIFIPAPIPISTPSLTPYSAHSLLPSSIFLHVPNPSRPEMEFNLISKEKQTNLSSQLRNYWMILTRFFKKRQKMLKKTLSNLRT
jgi:hypothetical protein